MTLLSLNYQYNQLLNYMLNTNLFFFFILEEHANWLQMKQTRRLGQLISWRAFFELFLEKDKRTGFKGFS